MEFIKDYEFTLHYHPRKANDVGDAWSRLQERCIVGEITMNNNFMEEIKML